MRGGHNRGCSAPQRCLRARARTRASSQHSSASRARQRGCTARSSRRSSRGCARGCARARARLGRRAHPGRARGGGRLQSAGAAAPRAPRGGLRRPPRRARAARRPLAAAARRRRRGAARFDANGAERLSSDEFEAIVPQSDSLPPHVEGSGSDRRLAKRRARGRGCRRASHVAARAVDPRAAPRATATESGVRVGGTRFKPAHH